MKNAHNLARGRGFTLIEALVSVALLAIGIVATLSSLGAISTADSRAIAAGEMQRLALQKYDELIATGDSKPGESAGDFTDVGDHRFEWRSERLSTGMDYLDSLEVDVAPRGSGFEKPTRYIGLICRVPDSGNSSVGSSAGSGTPGSNSPGSNTTGSSTSGSNNASGSNATGSGGQTGTSSNGMGAGIPIGPGPSAPAVGGNP